MSMKDLSFEEILARCLDEMAAGADLEQVVARYPAYAAELRPLLEAALRLREVPVPPPRPQAVRQGRARVIARSRPSRASGWGWLQGRRWVSALLTAGLILALLFGGGALGVQAAEASLPGDPFYGLKLWKESLELTWAEWHGDPAPLLVRQLERRSEEMETLQRQGRPVHPAVLQRSARLLIRLILLAERHPDHPVLRQRALQAIERHQAILLALRDRVPPAARPALERALERANRAREVLSSPVPPRPSPGPPPKWPPRGPGR
ncbi:hypothetical protein [Thermoflexus sp.]|uniref:hypothetical protein n=1 Tax=Thermoflexus sp. TaxID=1969742 RepID=UPI00176D112E|nr:hypothetical protein [Thermoflexus sp.]